MEDWKRQFRGWQYAAFKNGLFISTRDLNRYLDMIEKSFSEMIDEQNDPLTDDEAEGLSEQERDTFDYFYANSIFDKHSFPEEFYKSFVMSLYSKIEKEMIAHCERDLELRILVAPSDTEALGKGIHRAQKFLVQATGYTFDSQLWKELQLIRRVRNRLVHSDLPYIAPVQRSTEGNAIKVHIESRSLIQDYYLEMDTEFYNYVSKMEILEYSGASLDPEHEFAVFEIVPSYEYCRYLISFRKKLFLHLYNGLLEIAEAS